MKDNNINSILRDLAESGKPAAHIDLWPGLEKSLAVGDSQMEEGISNVRQKTVSRRIAFFALAVFAVIFILLATPQGRAIAQETLQFFTRASGISFPLQPGPEETPGSELDESNALMIFSSLAKAEEAIGFKAVEFPEKLQGYDFRNIEVDPALGIVIMRYDAVGGGGELAFAQSLSGFQSDSWSEVPPTAIEKVTLGNNEGEYAQGMFVVLPGSDSATWEPDAPVFRLRWKDGDRWFSLEKMGDVYPTEWLDKQAMIILAEGLSR